MPDTWPIAAEAGRRSMATIAHCSRQTQAEYTQPIQRYSFNASNEDQPPMHPDHEGAWVRYVDFVAAVNGTEPPDPAA